jgi:hypothetical protein
MVMSEVRTTEDFERIRAVFNEKVRNQNSSTAPVPWYQSQGRWFMGWKQLPSSQQEQAA